jgi:hypothetical protein
MPLYAVISLIQLVLGLPIGYTKIMLFISRKPTPSGIPAGIAPNFRRIRIAPEISVLVDVDIAIGDRRELQEKKNQQ